MNDLIDREQAVKIIDEIDTFCAGWRDYAISRIKSLPSAEKTGKWIDSIDHDGWFCSKCGYSISSRYGKYNYCPNCGSRMVE